jgi:hypothetical protein
MQPTSLFWNDWETENINIAWPIFFLVSWLISSRSFPLPALLACEGLEVSYLPFLCFQGLLRLVVDASHLFFGLSMPNTLNEKVNFTHDYYALNNARCILRRVCVI